MTTTSSAPASAPARPGRTERLSWGTKLSFPFAEFGSHFVWTTVGSWLLIFYTDVALITPAAAATIMLVARILDGVQDLGFGYLAERTRSRWGRFRPYIIFGAPLLAVSFVLAFTSPSAGSTAKVWYAGVTYVVLCFLYTVVNMSYGAMAGVMTTSTDDRLDLNWLRSVGGGLSQILLGAVVMPLLLLFSGAGDGETYNARGFVLTMGLLAVLAVPLFWVTAFRAREVITLTPEQSRVPFGRTVRAVLGNGQLMIVFAMLLINLVGLFGRLGLLAYYVINNMGSPMRVALVFTTFSVSTTVGQFAFPRFASVVGKARMLIISLSLSAASLLGIFLADPGNLALILVLTVVYGLAGFAAPIALSMVPDAVDYYEWKHGIRADGTAYATVSLSTKIANAVGGSLGLLIMGAFGYVGGARVQTDQALTGINVAANLVPAVLAAVAIIPLLFYRLDRPMMERITADLEARRAAEEHGGNPGGDSGGDEDGGPRAASRAGGSSSSPGGGPGRVLAASDPDQP